MADTLVTGAAEPKAWSLIEAYLLEREQDGPQWLVVRSFADRLHPEYPALAMPSSGDGENGAARLEWNSVDQLVLIDVSATGSLYWYARNRPSGVSSDGWQAHVGWLGDELRRWLETLPTVSSGSSG